MDIIQVITRELNVEKWQVEAAVRLIDEGCTIPFISRYRKEATGTLNDEQLRNLNERLTYLRNLEDKKAQVLGSIEEQGKLTPELKKQIEAAQTLVVVEDLYRPFRPKRRTRAIIAKEKEEELKTHFAVPFIENAKALDAYISVQSEAAVAVTSGVSAMHDVTEGGIFGALWEMAEASGVGLEIDLKKIPIRQETVEVCEFFGINPYKLISSGCMLMAAEDGNTLVRELEKEGIPATIIGKATEGNDRVLLNEDEKRFLEPPKTDELYEVMED